MTYIKLFVNLLVLSLLFLTVSVKAVSAAGICYKGTLDCQGKFLAVVIKASDCAKVQGGTSFYNLNSNVCVPMCYLDNSCPLILPEDYK